MTNIEERLADALNASYDAARALPLRPLSLRPSRSRRWVMLFAPVAAALAVVAVVTGLNALTGRVAPQHSSAPFPVVTGPGGVPRYYVELSYNGQSVVRSVATGKVTSVVPVRFPTSEGATGITSWRGVFYIAGATAGGTEIDRFRLTSAGQVTGLTMVKANDKLGIRIESMAVSPDGTKLAVAGFPNVADVRATGITVISLPSGAQHTWPGALTVKGYQNFTVTSLSWLASNDNLVFTGLWCRMFLAANTDCVGGDTGTNAFTEVRALNIAGSGHSLGQTRLLLRQSTSVPFIAASALSPDGSTITAVLLSGPTENLEPSHLAVRQFSAATGQPVRTLYQRATGPTVGWLLTPDSTGRYYLLDGQALFTGGNGPPVLQDKGYDGVLYKGEYLNLPPASGEVYAQAW